MYQLEHTPMVRTQHSKLDNSQGTLDLGLIACARQKEDEINLCLWKNG